MKLIRFDGTSRPAGPLCGAGFPSASGETEQIRETDSPHTRTHNILCDKRFFIYIYIYTYIYIYIYTYVYVCGVTTVSVRGFESRPTRCSPGLGDSPRSPTGVHSPVDTGIWKEDFAACGKRRLAHAHTHAQLAQGQRGRAWPTLPVMILVSSNIKARATLVSSALYP